MAVTVPSSLLFVCYNERILRILTNLLTSISDRPLRSHTQQISIWVSLYIKWL